MGVMINTNFKAPNASLASSIPGTETTDHRRLPKRQVLGAGPPVRLEC